MFYDKFTRLIANLRGLVAEGSVLSPLNRYLLVRDITFFVTDFYTGDRASDLGRLKADELFRLKDREGFLLNLTFSKTRCTGQLRPFCSVTRDTKCICLPGFLAELLYCRMWGVGCPSSERVTL